MLTNVIPQKEETVQVNKKLLCITADLLYNASCKLTTLSLEDIDVAREELDDMSIVFENTYEFLKETMRVNGIK